MNLSYIIFTFAVVICAWYGGLGTGLFSTFLCILFGVLYAPEPGSALKISSGEEQLRVFLFIMQGSFISLLSESVQGATRWQSLILGSISDAFITYDRNMRFMYVNKKAEELLKTDRHRLLGKRLLDIFPETKDSIFYKYARESFLSQKPKEFEMYVSGEDAWFHIALYPSNDGISVYYQDITKRKKIAKRLRENQLQLKRFVEANIIGVVVEDTKGTIYEANDMFLTMVGYSRDDLEKGKINWKKLTPSEYAKLDEEATAKLLRKGMLQPYVKEYIRKDNKRIFVLVGAVLLNKVTQRAMTFYLDITEQKELDKKKNEFISIASHELKTPLTSVKAFTQILMRQFKNTKDKRSLYFLTNINNQINKLDELINDLLDVSKIEEGRLNFRKQPFSVDAVVKKIIIDFQYMTQSHTIIKQGESSKLCFGDEDRIGQVISNLISNAIKYSPKADKVIVTVKDQKKNVLISVKDFGEGIPAADKEKIFARFFRSRKHEGSRISGFGLGLYITKAIIDSHKGTLHVESTEGMGATFTVTLPTIDEKNFRERKNK